MKQRLQALEIGETAQELLAAAGARWNVLAAVHGAIYISNPDRDLLWITDRPDALHPRAILIPGMPRHVPQCGDRLGGSDGLLSCQTFCMVWHQAETWTAREASNLDQLGIEFTERVIDAIRQATNPEQDLVVIGQSEVAAEGGGQPAARESASNAMARDLARSTGILSRVKVGRDVLRVLRAASRIVGLGQGLTPVGDDILGGYLYALRAAGNAHGMTFGIDWEGVIAWVQDLAQHTNVISHCLLLDHARGVACAPLAELMRAALEGARGAQLVQLASDVSGIGASSGRGLLAGVTAACEVLRTLRGGPLSRSTGLEGNASGHSRRSGIASVCRHQAEGCCGER